MSVDDNTDEESRTVAIGRRRPYDRASRTPFLSKSAERQHLQSHVPSSSSSTASITSGSDFCPKLNRDSDKTTDTSSSSGKFQTLRRFSSVSSMEQNNSNKDLAGTSLRGAPDLGRNRLAAGFQPRSEHNPSNHISFHDVVEISDDSDVVDDSEGGIMLNVDGPPRIDSSINADTSDERSPLSSTSITRDASKTSQFCPPNPQLRATPQSPSRSDPKDVGPMFRIDTFGSARTLADLSPEDLEKQIKYAFFHLRRDQIDLSRPVVCLACLKEGHSDHSCPGLLCVSCGGQTRHPTRLCPNQARCMRCGARSHNVDECRTKLRNTVLDSCEFCGGEDHVEASCTMQFFPARSERPAGEIQLWISCAQCGSREHLAGDCPAFGHRPSSVWCLGASGYSRENIVNLSLQRGVKAREKEAERKGLRPEGMPLQGSAPMNRKPSFKKGGPSRPWASHFDEDDEDFASRIASKRPRRPSPARKPMHFVTNDRYRHDRSYQHLRHQSPPFQQYRDRHGDRRGGDGSHQDRRDLKRRSRSKSPSRYSFEDAGTWRPPPTRATPASHASRPTGPAQPYNQRQQYQQPQAHDGDGQIFSKKQKRKAARDGAGGGGGGGVSIRPMPSAGKKAWNKGRL